MLFSTERQGIRENYNECLVDRDSWAARYIWLAQTLYDVVERVRESARHHIHAETGTDR